ncbi:PPE family protein [Mycobacterium sp. MFM001]|uniref:PPE family protein n=1 Tax=Mycobacterium sp. MFM001 TaxID=2049453 RepID=UPI000E2E9245|nr:PPE family protein [Mycobacterium sp. MFM001]
MFFDFGSLPPEINSARMYLGPGSGSMLAAAAAWDQLAAELHSVAADYQSVVSQLASGPWLGSASMSMAAAVAPYVEWMRTTARQAEHAAAQARAAAGAYESARASTVPPLVIAANRSLQETLVATNILGQNTPAIAATEFHYSEMWAQDAATMYGYAGASAAASKVTPFTPPPPTTNPGATQAALSRLTSAIPTTLQEAASPSLSTSRMWENLEEMWTTITMDPHFWSRTGSTITSVISTGKSLIPAAKAAESGVKASGSLLGGGLGSLLNSSAGSAGWAGAGGPGVAAGLGRAASIGALSVPQSWSAAVPAANSVAAAALPAGSGGFNAVPVSGPAGPAGVPVMPITGMAGHGAARLADAARFLPRPNMLPRWPAGG